MLPGHRSSARSTRGWCWCATGRFRRRGWGGTVDLDRTIGYLGEPGEEEQFAHPHGGDACTSVQLSPASWRQLVGEPGRMRVSTVYVDARTEFAHRKLLAAGRSDIDYRLAEELVGLLAAAMRDAAQRTPLHEASGPFDRRLVQRARAAIHDGHPAAGGLFGLAELVGASPYRLSRAFPRELGVPVTRYRNRVRVGRALDQLAHADSSVADVAALRRALAAPRNG